MKLVLNNIRIKALVKKGINLEHLQIMAVMSTPKTRSDIATEAGVSYWKVGYFMKKHPKLVDAVDQSGNKYRGKNGRGKRLRYVQSYTSKMILSRLN